MPRPPSGAQIPRHGRRNGLHHTVVVALGRRILGGEFSANAVLPPEQLLTEELGVSRTVVREAVKVLADKGMLDVRPKIGSRVRPVEDWNPLDADILEWRTQGRPDSKLFADLIELRLMIEPVASELAARRASDEAIEAIAAAYEGMRRAGYGSGDGYLEPDIAFHRAVLRASGNQLLAGLSSTIESALALSIRLSATVKDAASHALPLHEAVLNAIRQHKPKLAAEAMRRLIAGSEEDIRKVSQQSGRQ
jgi:DNA-binding FadR family transcriptional regulator